MRADLALVGFGHVGRRFARLIEERRDWLSLDYDLDCRVVGIATRHHGSVFRDVGRRRGGQRGQRRRRPPAQRERGAARRRQRSTSSAASPQSDAPLKVLVETTTLDINAGQPAIDYVRAALQAGCHVVTANKGPAAFAYEELSALAHDRDVSFLFEGAVMDGVPIFNLVRETLPAVEIAGFRGVVNSTTNHILSALEDGEGFDAALQRMQEHGDRRSGPLARRRRLGRRGEDGGAGQRPDARAHDAAGGRSRGHRAGDRHAWRWRRRRAARACGWSPRRGGPRRAS